MHSTFGKQEASTESRGFDNSPWKLLPSRKNCTFLCVHEAYLCTCGDRNISLLSASSAPVAQTNISTLRRGAIALTRCLGLPFVTHLLVAVGPSSLEEAGSDAVSGPTDAAVLSTLRLALAAWSLADVNGERARIAREARHGARADGPRNCMSSSSAVSHLGASVQRRSCVASDNGQNGFAVENHVHIGLVEWLGVGCFEKHLRLVLVRLAQGWVDAREPAPRRGVVADKLDTDVPGAQVALGMGE